MKKIIPVHQQKFERKCFKATFEDRKKAKKVMRELNKQGKNGDGNLTDIYFCEDCNGYHLTSLPKQRSRDYRRYLNK